MKTKLPTQKQIKKGFVSVIIPAYRAEKVIQATLIQVKDVLDQIRYRYEIICVRASWFRRSSGTGERSGR